MLRFFARRKQKKPLKHDDMKTRITHHVFILFLAVMIPGMIFSQSKIYALIVGVSKYSDHGITGLHFADKDAEAYRDFLQSPKGGSVPSKNIVMLTNEQATRAAIISAMRTLSNEAGREDMLIFFYSGHGVPDSKISGDLYFFTYETKGDSYIGTALLRDDIYKQMKNTQAKLKLCLLDACHAGGSGVYMGIKGSESGLVNKLQNDIAMVKEPSWVCLSASSSSEESSEDGKWGGGHGVFTYELIQGLEGEADKTQRQSPAAKGNSDGVVTARELYDYLYNVIPAETNRQQHPDKDGGNLDQFPMSASNTGKWETAVKNFKSPPEPIEINKTQPETNNSSAEKEDKPHNDTQTKDLDMAHCTTSNRSYGDYTFINNYGEDILLTRVIVGQTLLPNLNILIAQSEKNNAPQLVSGFLQKRDSSVTRFRKQSSFSVRPMNPNQ